MFFYLGIIFCILAKFSRIIIHRDLFCWKIGMGFSLYFLIVVYMYFFNRFYTARKLRADVLSICLWRILLNLHMYYRVRIDVATLCEGFVRVNLILPLADFIEFAHVLRKCITLQHCAEQHILVEVVGSPLGRSGPTFVFKQHSRYGFVRRQAL